MPRRESLSPDQARRVLLAAQGFGGATGPAGTRTLLNGVRRLGLLQIDSVNVLIRAHYLPMFSRLGTYDRELLERASGRAPRRLFEYWGHEASLLPVETHPLLRWRMSQPHAWGGVSGAAADNPQHVTDVLAAVGELGPVTATELEAALAAEFPRTEHWGWNWSVTKRVLEHLFWTGEITSAGRDSSFRRQYALAEQVLPRDVLLAPTPDRADAIRALVAQAAAALGVATQQDLQDYFRLPVAEARTAVAELVAAGTLQPVRVPGWPTAFLHEGARVPRAVAAEALLVPFDPLIWERRRVARAFGMQYRIEIYVPQEQRRHGYYVLPFLLGDQLVARVDLKADRSTRRLLVRSAWLEPGHDPAHVADRLSAHLEVLGRWLGLADVVPPPLGDLPLPNLS